MEDTKPSEVVKINEPVKPTKLIEPKQPVKRHPDRPTFRVFVLKLCEHELRRIDEMTRTLKKARKEYIDIHNITFLNKNDETLAAELSSYEKIAEAYDQVDAKLYEIDAQLAKERAALKEQRDAAEASERKDAENDTSKN